MALAGLAAVVALSTLAGCSGDDEAAKPGSTATSPTAPVIQPGRPGEANTSLSGTAAVPKPKGKAQATDVKFMQDMVIHHAQALTMVDLALPRLTRADSKAMAARIKAEQRPEIGLITRWLTKHGESVPPQATKPQMAADSHHSGMPGMATKAELLKLQDAKGPDVDRQFLTLMIRHHQGAITMVLNSQDTGTDDEVERFGNDIQSGQGAQITHMQRMRRALS